eukprot:4416312-Amphidinium_carterae.3
MHSHTAPSMTSKEQSYLYRSPDPQPIAAIASCNGSGIFQICQVSSGEDIFRAVAGPSKLKLERPLVHMVASPSLPTGTPAKIQCSPKNGVHTAAYQDFNDEGSTGVSSRSRLYCVYTNLKDCGHQACRNNHALIRYASKHTLLTGPMQLHCDCSHQSAIMLLSVWALQASLPVPTYVPGCCQHLRSDCCRSEGNDECGCSKCTSTTSLVARWNSYKARKPPS